MINVYASVNGRDLGGVADEVTKNVKEVGEAFAQRQPHRDSRSSANDEVLIRRAWRSGCVGAIVLVYLLIVVNFQSWLDPFIIITALPGALAGICWMLLITHTTLSVPSLTGAIMSVGVATSNSILMVSFAREQMDEGKSARDAALEAGFVRMRPVVMTALAMIIGMVPMAIGLGEGGEQNAPLGRAVIGGLLFATFATLFFVPCVFSMIHGTWSAERHTARKRRPREIHQRQAAPERSMSRMLWNRDPRRPAMDRRPQKINRSDQRAAEEHPRSRLFLVLLVVGGRCCWLRGLHATVAARAISSAGQGNRKTALSPPSR